MKLVFIMHNHPTTFVTPIKDIYDPKEYRLFGLFNNSSHSQLVTRGEDKFFEQIFVQEGYDFEYLTGIIDDIRSKNPNLEIAIVTTWEDDVDMCGMLNVHYKIEQRDYKRFVDKAVMKNALKGVVGVPKHIEFDKTKYAENPKDYLTRIETEIGQYPMFVMPVDQNGSMGAEKIETRDQLQSWCDKVSKDKFKYEVDEFLDEKEWTLFHCDSFIQNGQVFYTQVCIYSRPCHNFVLGKSVGSRIFNPQDPLFAQLQEFTEKALIQLGIPRNGMTHMEVFVKNNDFRFLEVAYRPGGAFVYKMYEQYLGRNILVDHLKLQIDPNYKINIEFGAYCGFAMWPIKKGVVTQINSIATRGNQNEFFKIRVGQEFSANDLSCLLNVAGAILVHHSDLDIVQRDCEVLKDACPFVFVERPEPKQSVGTPILSSSSTSRNDDISSHHQPQLAGFAKSTK